MKISKLFHWLYASLLFLPFVVLPVFAIYSRNENAQFNYEVTRQEIRYCESNLVETYEDLHVGNIYKWTNNVLPSTIAYNGAWNITVNTELFKEQFTNYAETNIDHVTLYQDTNTSFYYRIFPSGGGASIYETINAKISLFVIESISNQQLITSQMCEHFEYTDYKWTRGLEYVTYNDTDIGSQMVYTLYNTVDKYFNMSSIFGMDGIGNWILVNILNNNYVLGFTIFWDLLVYWFFISIFWLVFDVLLYVPNLVHRWLDKSSLT